MKENPLIIKQLPWIEGNFTTDAHLGNALMLEPQKWGRVMERAFTSYNANENFALSSILSNMGNDVTLEQGKEEWTWDMRGKSFRPFVYRGTALTGTPGRGKAPFVIPFDNPDAKPADILSPGNPKYQVRVQNVPPQRAGDTTYYTVVMNTDNPADYMPLKYLKNGVRWGKLYATAEEGSKQGGSTSFSLPITLKNRLGRLRKEYEITDNAAQRVMRMSIPDSQGRYTDLWVKYAEWEFWNQFYKERERYQWYGLGTKTLMGSTNRPIFEAVGIETQLAQGGAFRMPYNVLTARLIEDFLMGIAYTRVAPGKKRRYVGFAGEAAMMEFNRAVLSKYHNTGFITLDTNWVTPVNSPYHANGLSFGAQFFNYKMHNGLELTLVHNPIYDDPDIHSELDPITGYPLESFKITLLNLSGEGGNNIYRVKKKNGFKLRYIPGLASPYDFDMPGGGTKMGADVGFAAHGGDDYKMVVIDYVGTHIHDVSECGQLYLART